MPLDKIQLKKDLKKLTNDMRNATEDTDEQWAENMATIIENYIKGGDIVVRGIVTAGSPTTQTQTIQVTTKME